MAKHLSRKDIRNIGNERIAVLTDLSRQAVRDGRDDRARRYVQLARAIGGKTQTGMPEGFRYCKECLLPLMPGTNCRIRLTGGKITVSCVCGGVRRMPYLKEQRK